MQQSTNRRMFHSRLLPAAVCGGCLLLLSLTAVRQTQPNGGLSFKDIRTSPVATKLKTEGGKTDVEPTLQGTAALEYLEETHDGRSLAEAVTAARFGLKWQEHSPFESTTNLNLSSKDGGYLGMSHVQNLIAWFDDQGVTIRPTKFEGEKEKAWGFGMKLRAYGYGKQLLNAPPVVSRNVKDNRIEYGRSTDLVDSSQQVASRLFNPQSTIRNPKLIEWYENRAAGIEQGFTLNAPPERKSVGHGEPLRLVIALKGDLSAAVKNDGSGVELLGKSGDAVMTYGQLVAKDARGRKLPARIEGNAERDEIALVVDDKDAVYPVEIDPITASLEQKLTSPSPQAGAEFGDAVAISGNVAVLGAFREDSFSSTDVGKVYIFTRTDSTWTFKYSTTLGTPSAQCGWSVAIEPAGGRVAFGCPGYNSNSGFVEVLQTDNNWSTATGVAVNPTPVSTLGDRYGESVGLSRNWVFAGAPFSEAPGDNTIPNVGNVYGFLVDSNLTIDEIASYSGKFINSVIGRTTSPNSNFGASLAVTVDPRDPRLEILIVGMPGANSQTGAVQVFHAEAAGRSFYFSDADFLKSSDGVAGDLFSYGLAISGDTAVIGAPLNDNAKGTDVGAVYVFKSSRTNGHWNQQQKLIPSDGIDQDQFGESVAIEGNTIVVGSPYNGSKTFIGTRGNGRSYVFTRNIDTWTEQTIISALFDGAPVDKFGIAVAFSDDTVISGAEHAAVGNASDAGAAYIHRLDCVPPENWIAISFGDTSATICPGSSIRISDSFVSGKYPGNGAFSLQWRKNGVNIPGAPNGAYEIQNASAADAGVYDFIISNQCGAEISTPFTLTVYTLTVFPSSMNIGYPGTTGSLAVNSNGSCAWTAQSNASWITITSGSSGTGNGNVGFKIDPNTSTSPRTGTMTVARGTVTVMQDAAPNAPPAILIEEGTVNRAVAVDSVTFVHGPFSIFDDHNFSADRHTRVIIFTSDLGLSQPDSSILTVRAGVFPLAVENVGTVTGVPGLSASFIVVRLPDGLLTGDLPLTVTLRGVASSNNPTISIKP